MNRSSFPREPPIPSPERQRQTCREAGTQSQRSWNGQDSSVAESDSRSRGSRFKRRAPLASPPSRHRRRAMSAGLEQVGRPKEHWCGGDEDASQVLVPRDRAALSPGLARNGTGHGSTATAPRSTTASRQSSRRPAETRRFPSSCTPSPTPPASWPTPSRTASTTTELSEFDAVAAYLTQDEIQALSGEDFGQHDRRRQPGVRVRLRQLARHHQPRDRPRQGHDSRRRRPHGRRRRRRRRGQRCRDDIARSRGYSRIVAWKDFVNAQEAPVRRRRPRHVRRRAHRRRRYCVAAARPGRLRRRCSSAASRPAADIVGLKVLDATGQGRASAVMSGVAVGRRPQAPVQHPGAQPLDRRQRGGACRVRPDRLGRRVRLEARHHRRVLGRQRG